MKKPKIFTRKKTVRGCDISLSRQRKSYDYEGHFT